MTGATLQRQADARHAAWSRNVEVVSPVSAVHAASAVNARAEVQAPCWSEWSLDAVSAVTGYGFLNVYLALGVVYAEAAAASKTPLLERHGLVSAGFQSRNQVTNDG